MKKHWENLVQIVENLENGEITFKFQNSLPVRLVKAEGKIENKDLTIIEK